MRKKCCYGVGASKYRGTILKELGWGQAKSNLLYFLTLLHICNLLPIWYKYAVKRSPIPARDAVMAAIAQCIVIRTFPSD